jgi:hypothetical protein
MPLAYTERNVGRVRRLGNRSVLGDEASSGSVLLFSSSSLRPQMKHTSGAADFGMPSIGEEQRIQRRRMACTLMLTVQQLQCPRFEAAPRSIKSCRI